MVPRHFRILVGFGHSQLLIVVGQNKHPRFQLCLHPIDGDDSNVVLQCNVTYLAYSWHVSRARITVLALLSLFRQLHDIRQDIMSGYCSACKLLPRVSMQCMQSAILLWQIRPSVSPKPVLCVNEWIYRQFFHDLVWTSF